MKRTTVSSALLFVVALGLAFRLVHFSAIAETAFPELPRVFVDSDMHATLEWVQTILAGDWIGRATYHPYFGWMRTLAPPETWYRWWGGREIFQQAPLYTYWTAGLYALLNGSLPAILLCQLLLGSLDAIIVYFLASRLFDERAGLLAAGATALYGPFIFHQGTLLRDWLPPILDPLMLLLLLRAKDSARKRDWILAGMALGISILTKEGVLMFLPVLLLWLLTCSTGSREARWHGLYAVMIGLVLMLSPLMIRNLVVGAPILSISNRSLEGFIEGNASDGDPLGFALPPSLPSILDHAHGRAISVIVETLSGYHGEWSRYVHLLQVKCRAILDPTEIQNNHDLEYGKELSPILRWSLGYAQVFPLGFMGLVLSLPTWRRHSLLLGYTMSVVIGLLVMIILARYRLVLIPPLIMYGAAGLVTLFDALRSRRRDVLMTGMALFAASVLLQQRIAPLPDLRTIPELAVHIPEYGYSAQLYRTAGKYDRAVEEMTRLRARATRTPELARNAASWIDFSLVTEGDDRIRLANQLHRSGKVEEAQAEAARAHHVFREYLDRQPQAARDLQFGTRGENAPQLRGFFLTLLSIRPPGEEAESIRTLLEWLR